MKTAKLLSIGMCEYAAAAKVNPEYKVRSIYALYEPYCKNLLANEEMSKEEKVVRLSYVADEMNDLFYLSVSQSYATSEDKLLRAIFGRHIFSEISILREYKANPEEFYLPWLRIAAVEIGASDCSKEEEPDKESAVDAFFDIDRYTDLFKDAEDRIFDDFGNLLTSIEDTANTVASAGVKLPSGINIENIKKHSEKFLQMMNESRTTFRNELYALC